MKKPRPYTLYLGYAQQADAGNLRWLKRESFPTLEAAERMAERLMRRQWWIATYRVEGPRDGSETAANGRHILTGTVTPTHSG